MRKELRYGLAIGVTVVMMVALFVAYVNGVGGVYQHDHGQLDVTIDGEEIDFDQARYHDQDPEFHFHEGEDRWHIHPASPLSPGDLDDWTVSEALETLDMDATESTFTMEGETYDDVDDGTSVDVEANGEPIDPEEFVLEDGDEVAITVES